MSSLQVVEEKKKKDDRIPTWMVAGGVALLFAVFTAGTVYVIKRNRRRRLREARYGDDYPESNFKTKLEKYWNLGVKTWKAVSSVIGDFLKPKEKTVSPLVNATAAAMMDHFETNENEF